MKKLSLLLFILTLLFSCQSSESSTKTNAKAEVKKTEVKTNSKNLDALSNETMIIETKHGAITLKFYPNAAPKTVARIANPYLLNLR